MADGVQLYRRALREGEEARALQRLSSEPAQARAMEQFRRAVDKATDVRAVLRDPRVLNVLARALGVPQAAEQPGLAQRVLLSDLKDQKSLANVLPDRRWREAAGTLNLREGGVAVLRDPALQARLREGLARAARHEELEAQAPGLGDAVLFREQAAKATSAYDILGNSVLRRVVTGALGLPREIAVQSVETQARAVESRLKPETLGDPKVVQRLVERYLVARGSEAGSGTGGGLSSTLLLFA